MEEKMLALSWKYHDRILTNVISKYREKEYYSDVTLACAGHFYPVHKLVLSACSDYFEEMLQHTHCTQPVLVLSDISAKNLEALLSYMYEGVTNVAQDELTGLIRAAEALRIKGLAVPDVDPEAPSEEHWGRKTRKKKKDNGGSSIPSGGTRKGMGQEREVQEQEEEEGKQEASGGRSSQTQDLTPSGCRSEEYWNHSQSNAKMDCTPDLQTYESTYAEMQVKEEAVEGCKDKLDLSYDYPTLPGSEVDQTEGDSGGEAQGGLPHQHPAVLGYDAMVQASHPCHMEPATAFHPGPSTLPQNMSSSAGDGFEGFHGFEGYNCDNQPELYSQANLQSPQFQQGLENTQEPAKCGRPPKVRTLLSSSFSPHKKVHRCAHCNYSTHWHSVFIRHCRTHSGEKPFSCSFCSFRSSRKSIVTRHCLSKHSAAPTNPVL